MSKWFYAYQIFQVAVGSILNQFFHYFHIALFSSYHQRRLATLEDKQDSKLSSMVCSPHDTARQYTYLSTKVYKALLCFLYLFTLATALNP